MSYAYDQYLSEHIGNVNKSLHWMLDNLGLKEEKTALEEAMVSFNHDESKYSTEEYDAYDQYFYGGNRSYKVVQDFNYAWLHHIHQNPHHWQYWVLINDDPGEDENGTPHEYLFGNFVALMIPLPYIFEMIADWWSFSWKKGNLFEIFNWYAEHRNYQYIHPESRKIIEAILKKIWDVLIMQETVAGHDISEIEKQYRRFWAEQEDLQPAFGKLEYNPDDEDSYREAADNAAVTEYGNDVEFYGLRHADSEPIGKVIGVVESENGLEITVEHSDEEDDEDLYGVPELKKFPMPDKKHVKSAIRFFNYVDPKYEKELAEAIIEKAEEFGLDLESDISVGDENKFKKYLPEKKEES